MSSIAARERLNTVRDKRNSRSSLTTGLNHPYDLRDWQHWQESRRPLVRGLRRVRGLLRPAVPDNPQTLWLFTRGRPRVLAAVDARSASNRASVIRPLHYLQESGVAVVSSLDLQDILPDGDWHIHAWSPESDVLRDVLRVYAAGHYLAAGEAAYRFSLHHDLPYGVVQHGLLTPFSPPLPFGSHVLSWSREDGQYWAGRRSDLSVTPVGSQLLQDARRSQADLLVKERQSVWKDRAPVYLGQLHGVEMGWPGMARAALATCRRTGAVYRPHPSEQDLLSGLIHRAWRLAGVSIQTSGVPIADLDAPVLGVFSTGVLEAAASGLPAWVDFPRPPRWLSEFWERNGMARLGEQATEPPRNQTLEPAKIVAAWASDTD